MSLSKLQIGKEVQGGGGREVIVDNSPKVIGGMFNREDLANIPVLTSRDRYIDSLKNA